MPKRRWKRPEQVEKEIKEKLAAAGKKADAIDFNKNLYKGNFILAMQRENDAAHQALLGKTWKEIEQFLKNKYNISKSTALRSIIAAKTSIKSRKDYEVNNLISLHASRYEAIYETLRGIGSNTYAMDALKGIEKLIGFHREGFYMRVNNQEVQQLSLKNVADEYDLSKLDTKKRARFRILLNKSKTKK